MTLIVNEQQPRHRHGAGVDLALERQQVLLRADRDWLAAVIGRLSQRPDPR